MISNWPTQTQVCQTPDLFVHTWWLWSFSLLTPWTPCSSGSILKNLWVEIKGYTQHLKGEQNKVTHPALPGTQRNKAHLESEFNEGVRKFTMGNIWSKRKNPTSITSACFQPLVTIQKVLSGSITPHLGLAQRWFFKEKMPFGIFELWQRKNRPLKNTHPKSITIFKSPVSKKKKKKKKGGDTPELQLGLAVCDASVSGESQQTDNAIDFKGKPWPQVS